MILSKIVGTYSAIGYNYDIANRIGWSLGQFVPMDLNSSLKPNSAQYCSDILPTQLSNRLGTCFKKNQERPNMTTTSTQTLMKVERQTFPASQAASIYPTIQLSTAKGFPWRARAAAASPLPLRFDIIFSSNATAV